MVLKNIVLKKSILLLTGFLISLGGFAQESRTFLNPILAGYYPDPSITRVGEDYYLIHSTFAYFPGVPIFHSKDLVNWRQIGHVLDRAEQLDVDGLGITRGIFAPAISHHKGTFYMITTLVDKGGNFVVTATDPAGPWSNPVWLSDVNGIDPSIFFDDDDRAYIVYNSEAPDNKPLYDGHRTIRMLEFDYKNLKTTGPQTILVNGGVDISKKPVWIEGPHVYKKGDYYYLMAAEGGTSVNHSEVILRSKNIRGEYVPYAENPILTQRHLSPDRPFPVSATGHADLVETQNGEWWAVFLATRPYDKEDHYNIGRETFLAPVRWVGGWPIINPDYEEVQYAYPIPKLPASAASAVPLNGNFTYRDNFDTESLPLHWSFARTPRTQWYSLAEPAGSLTVALRPETLSGTRNPSFVARRQQHWTGSASTKMQFNPAAANEFAGMALFQGEQNYYAFGKTLNAAGEPVVQLLKSIKAPAAGGDGATEVVAEQKLSPRERNKPLFLKYVFDKGTLSFHYATKEGDWKLLQEGVDGTFLSTRVAGGFVGTTVGPYATSQAKPSNAKASYDWFEYQGNDAVYESKEILFK
ncbi:glycoside hydrolase family 43 protein [Cesiribacter sp. SM1]|uniref:glycoside hydrolase family 43 protein n=1 Tax=Cesiribacter sp. SM1 TaxID=2861196 RepID=UPI001CD332CE|nr:glycoside hydrolase family 43 protein [Cesiribacter sp. SM1]